MAEIPEENPFDLLAEIVKPAQNYEEARKCVWTAMKSGKLPEEKVITLLISATAMPALAAANIQMEQLLHAADQAQEAPSTVEAAPTSAPTAHPLPRNVVEFPGKPRIN